MLILLSLANLTNHILCSHAPTSVLSSLVVGQIKREFKLLFELRPTRPVQTAFEIIDYFKCETSEIFFAELSGQNKENSLELSRSDKDWLHVNSQE